MKEMSVICPVFVVTDRVSLRPQWGLKNTELLDEVNEYQRIKKTKILVARSIGTNERLVYSNHSAN